jgi:hypothetical protein
VILGQETLNPLQGENDIGGYDVHLIPILTNLQGGISQGYDGIINPVSVLGQMSLLSLEQSR